jgi:hypothetical protein
LLAANSGFRGLLSRSLDVPVVGFVSIKTHTPAATEVYVIGFKHA